MVHFHLDYDGKPVKRKVRFHNFMEMLKEARSNNPRKMLFETYLLMSLENQKKMREADKVSTCISLSNLSRAAFISEVSYSFNFLPLCGLLGKGTFVIAAATWPWPQPLPLSFPPPPLPDIMKLKKKETNRCKIRAKHEYKRGNRIEKLKEIIFCNP